VRTKAWLLAGAFLFPLLLPACGGDDDDSSTATAPGGVATTGDDESGATPSATTAADEDEGSGDEAQLPEDACQLLTLSEVQTVASGASEGEPGSESTPAVRVVDCFWSGTGGDLASLTLTISTLPEGFSEDDIRLALETEANESGENGGEIPGVGDFAAYSSAVEIDVTAKALVHGLLVDVSLNATGARTHKDEVIALLKAAVERI
jgi:hypothetical protein